MKIKWTVLAVLCAVFVISTAVRAENPIDKRWYIAPGVNYIFADRDRISDNDPGLRIGLGKAVDRRWNLEINAMIDNLSGTGDFKQKGLSLNALYFLTRDSEVSPYGVIGLGVLNTKYPGEKSTNLMAEIGIGLGFSEKNDWAFRVEARHRYDGDSSSIASEDYFNDWLAGLTLIFPLGKNIEEEEVEKVQTVKAPPPGDDDRDGVINDIDFCPDTPAGVKVDFSGCPSDSDNDGIADSQDNCPNTPSGVSVDSRGCPADSDGDGVADHLDKCPDTPSGAKVDASGCPLDSDGDGVVDFLDKCPDTKPNLLIDDKGCALPEKVSFTLKIVFESARADMKPEHHSEIKELADFMKKYPTTSVEIGGHTDNVGAEAANVELSLRRAEAVRKYLIEEFGIDASRVAAKGYGPSKPVADNSTAVGRSQNRRVEAVVETVIYRKLLKH